MNTFSFEVRSIQLDLARQMESIEFLKEFARFAVGNGYNSLTLYLEGRIRTPSFPYPAVEESYTPEQIEEVVGYAGSLGLDTIPVVSTLGHAEQFLKHPALASLGETRKPFVGRFGPGPACVFCPSQDATYDFLSRYLSEVSGLFPSSYFHVGCDETWDIGCCDLCRQRLALGESQGDIFAKHLTRIHRMVTQGLGKRMMIWDDMFEFYPEALEVVPRDVILACWQYHDHVTEARGHFLNRAAHDSLSDYDRLGFEYLICPSDFTNTIHNAESFTAYGAKHRPLGGLMTTWEKSDCFLLQSMPLLAAVGRLWASGVVQKCDQILDVVTEEMFGLDDKNFSAAMKALCRSGIPVERRTALAEFLTRRENTTDYGRRALVDVLVTLLPDFLGRVTGTGRPILQDILLSLRGEQLGFLLDDLLPTFFETGSARGAAEVKLHKIRSQLMEVDAGRMAIWGQIRPGISSAGIESLFQTRQENLARVHGLAAKHGTLTVHFLLPDQYSRQTVRISVLYEGSPAYEIIAEGVFKETRSSDCYYSKIFLVARDRIPKCLRIDTFGFGGQGFTYFAWENECGQFVPASIHAAQGLVADPENLLTHDWTWAFAGERNARKGFMDPELAASIHGFEVALKKRGEGSDFRTATESSK